MLSVILLFVIVSLGFYALRFYAPRERRRILALAAQVPTYKGAIPFVGHFHKVIGGTPQLWKTLKEISKLSEEAGGVLSVWAGPSILFVINDPDDAVTVLNSCLKKSFLYRIVESFAGQGLLTADVPFWKRNRKLLNSTFSQHVLDSFMDVFNEQAALLARDLEPLAGSGEFDPQECFSNRTLRTVCKTTLGLSMDDDKSVIDQTHVKALRKIFHMMATRMSSFWLYSDFIYGLTSAKKQEDEAMATILNTSRSVIYKKRAERQETIAANTSPRRFMAFLDLLLDMVEKGVFTDEQVIEELNTVIFAGFDTSVRTLNTVLVLLGTYPDVQEKVYQEVMSLLGSNADLHKKDMTKLVYTAAAIKEALRINPVIPFISREIQKDIKLKNYTLPAGSGCIVSLWGIHRLPIWGPDRFEFRPERWLDPASLPQSPGAYCAFSIGRRGCIGKSYAVMALNTMLVHLIRKFRVTADYSQVKCAFDIGLKFEGGHHISLELRK